jgi:predicted regulator of Ras-like GTPase activity (Roadblock/LC7/MglB family)
MTKDNVSIKSTGNSTGNNAGKSAGKSDSDNDSDKTAPRPTLSLIVSEADSKRIKQQLDRLVIEAGANSTLLLDKSGEVIAARGERLPRDLSVLGALLAGTFATSREVARMMNDTNFRTLIQQGMRENTLTELVGESWIVVVIFDKSTHVGLIKDLCRRITPELEAVLLQVQRRSRSVNGLNPTFRTSIEDTIDLLFKD